MTTKELEQPDRTFRHAGRTAFLLGVDVYSNPYKTVGRIAELWEKGFKAAERELRWPVIRNKKEAVAVKTRSPLHRFQKYANTQQAIRP